MKKLLIVFLCLIAVQVNVKADDDKVINFEKLPAQSQRFVKQHFSSVSIALIKEDSDFFDKSYSVIFTNGDKVKFDRKGNWKDLDCKYSNVPSIVVPETIKKYVAQHYPQTSILEFEKEDKGGYELKLSNGIELTFNSKLVLTDIDN